MKLNLKLLSLGFSALICGFLLSVPMASALGLASPRDLSTGVHTMVSTVFSGEGSAELSTADQVDTVYCPDTDAWHQHAYINTSGYTEGYEYYMYVKYLRFYLHDDFVDSVDLDTMECSTPSGYVACDGGTATDDGGIRISVVTGDTSSDAEYPDYIQWEYGTSSRADRPFIPGYNDYDEDGNIDTYDSVYRQFYETVDFEFKDGVTSGESATTDSALYVDFYAYDQSCGSWGSSSCWEEVEEDGETGYHWNNHTTTLTTLYECDSVACKSLSLSPTTDELSINDVFTDIPFTVTATGTDDSDITADSTFTYSVNRYGSANDAADANGTLRYNRFGLTASSKNPTTTDSTVTFRDTEPGDTLYVYVSDYDGTSYESTCSAEVQLPYCTDLSITDPGGMFSIPYLGTVHGDPYETNISIDSETSTGESWPFDVTYESTDTEATFDGNANPYTTTDTATDIAVYSSSDSASVSVGIDPAYDVAGTCNDSFYYTLIPEVTLPACATLEITTPSAPITEEVMEAGDVQISWTSTLTDGTPNPSSYTCTSSNAAGTFRDLSGVEHTGMINTYMTTVFYNGQPGDTVTCMSSSPYSSPTCIDTITSETDSTGPVCTDLVLSDPYVENADGTTTTIDTSNTSSVETLYDNKIVCYDFTLTTEVGFGGNLVATGYTDSSRTNSDAGILNLVVDGESSDSTDPASGKTSASVAFSNLTGETTYTGTLCWENFDENYVFDLGVTGENACEVTDTLPTTSGGGGDDDDDNGGGHHGGHSGNTCDDVVEVNDEDDGQICEEYSMEVCVEDDDIEVVSNGDEICYYDQDDTDHSDPLKCEDDSLTIPGKSKRICYDVEIQGNVCNGDISVEYNGKTCFEDAPEQAEVGVLNKFIYTFNFISNKVNNSDEDVFFTHDEDRTFYTLEYTPSGAESTLVFTDDMWDSSGIEGVFGSTGNDSEGHIDLAKTLGDLTDYEYNYTTIKAFGFGDQYEEGSDDLATYVKNFTSSSYQTFVPYLKYDDSSVDESEIIYACAPSENEDGDTVYGEDGLLCYNPDYTPEADGRVVILNADAIPSDATLRIRYVGVIVSGIADECDTMDDECLTEIFENSAKVFADPSDVEDPENTDTCTEDEACSEDSAKLVVLCSYLMTQNAGDIYLEGDLNSGSDISCAYIDDEQNYSSYSNTDGLIIKQADGDDDDDDSTSSVDASSGSTTYYDSNYSSSSVSICDNASDDNFIGNISSYVCEIVSAVSDLWKGSTVSETTDSRVEQSVRNASTAQASTKESYGSWTAMADALTNTNNEDSGILYFEGDGNGSAITLGEISVPCGAWTLIVKDADLKLGGNISYDTSCTNGKSYTTDLPSIAFVVEGGDIYIENEDSVSRLVGVYYTDQNIDGADRSAVDGSLKIDGSIYGNVGPLLKAANYVGPPTLDGGSVVVRYDSRILLNTPPGLSEYVDVDTQKGVN